MTPHPTPDAGEIDTEAVVEEWTCPNTGDVVMLGPFTVQRDTEWTDTSIPEIWSDWYYVTLPNGETVGINDQKPTPWIPASDVLHRPAPGGGGVEVERVMRFAEDYANAHAKAEGFGIGGYYWKTAAEASDAIEAARKNLRQSVEALDARPGLRLEEGEVVVNAADLKEAMSLLTYQLDSMGIDSEACDRLRAALAREGR